MSMFGSPLFQVGKSSDSLPEIGGSPPPENASDFPCMSLSNNPSTEDHMVLPAVLVALPRQHVALIARVNDPIRSDPEASFQASSDESLSERVCP